MSNIAEPEIPANPRVLHIGSHSIGSTNNTGYTLSRIFENWPEDSLKQVILQSEISAGDRFGCLPVPGYVAPVDYVARKFVPRKSIFPITDGLNNSIRGRSQASFKAKVKGALSIVNDLSPVYLPKETDRAIRRYSPQVIHSALGGVRVMRFALLLSDKYDIPILPHFMDDWPTQMFGDRQLGGLARLEFDRLFEKVLARSPLLLTISNQMAEEYANRYSRKCVTVGNCLDSSWGLESSDSRIEHRRLTYAGGIHLGRAAVLAKIGEDLDELNTAFDKSYELKIYAAQRDAPVVNALARKFRSIDYGGSVSQRELPQILQSSGINIFVESCEPEIFDYTRLSMSTKVPEYLAAGRPILAFGPAAQASIATISDSSIGHYAGQREFELDLDGISVLLQTLAGVSSSQSLPIDMQAANTRSKLEQAICQVAQDWVSRSDFTGSG